jgi:DNA polymerase I
MAHKKETFVLIDGHAMLYRAWFAFPQTLTTVDGKLVNAVYGFTRILLTVLNEIKPTYLAVSFDVGKTFRHEQYPAYKAHREKMPEELKEQEPMVDRVLNALNVPVFAKDGFEADDVIGTLSRQASLMPLEKTPLT